MKTRRTKGNLTADRLRAALAYDPLTGYFVWSIRPSNVVKAGTPVRSTNPDGYIVVSLDYMTYLAHRLAWFHVHGEWPKGQIDHINGDRADNRIANLRDVTDAVNQQNRRAATTTNKLGVLGVRQMRSGRFTARIMTEGRALSLGAFLTPEEAHAAYLSAKRALHEGCTI